MKRTGRRRSPRRTASGAAEVLAEVARISAQTLDVGVVGQRIAESVRTLLRATATCVLHRDPVTEGLVAVGVAGEMVLVEGQRLPPGVGMAGLALREGVPVTTRNVLADPRLAYPGDLRARLDRVTYRAVVAVPLDVRGQVIGVLIATDAAPRAFTAADVRLAEAFADHAAVALENAALYRRLEERATRLETLGRLNQLISSSLEVPVLLGEVARAAVRLTGAPVASFWLADEDARVLRGCEFSDPSLAADFPVSTVNFGDGLLGWIAAQRRPLRVDDVFADGRLAAPGWWQAHELTSFFGLPVVLDDRLLAVLSLNARRPFALGAEGEAVLTSLVTQVALTLRNAQLFSREQAARAEAEASARALRASETFLRAIFETEPECVTLLNRTGAILAVNRAGLELFEADSLEQLMGESTVSLVVDEHREAFRGLIALVFEGRSGQLEFDAVGLRGTRRSLDTHVVPLRDDRQDVVALLGITRDVTTRKRAEAELRERNRRSLLAGEIGAAFARSDTLEATLRRCAEAIRRRLDLAFVRLWTLDHAAGVLELQGSAGDTADTGLPPARVPIGQLGIGRTAVSGQPYLTNALSEDGQIGDPDWVRREGLVAFAGFPLPVENRVVGAVAMFARRPLDGTTLEAVGTVAAELGQFIERKRVEHHAAREAAFVRLLQVVAVAANEAASLEDALREGLGHVCRHTGVPVGHAFLSRTAGGALVSNGIWYLAEAERFAALRKATEAMAVAPASGLLERVRTTARPAWVGDLGADPAGPRDIVAAAAGLRGAFAFPVLVGTDVAALLECFATDPIEPDEEFLEVMAHIGTQLGRVVERERAADALLRGEEQVRQLQKLEAVGRLAGGVAHDFNNLLTVISGRTQLLLRRLPGDHPSHRDVRLIADTAERAATLTQQLLAFSRKQVLRPQVLDLNGVVAGMGAMLRRLIREDIDLVLRPGPDLARVRADLGQIEQVITNLVLNARDAMPDGGRLVVETANVVLDQELVGAGARPGAHVMMAVSDTGVGIDAEAQSRIFEPFFTTKEVGKGTGLGLATVYGIVKQHDGSIAVDSAPGRGATFRVYLPSVEAVVEVARPRADQTEFPQGAGTILVVEDEDAVRDLAVEVLEMSGYTVLVAALPEPALALAGRHSGRIDLLLTDIVMPQMSGRELADRVTAVRPDTRVLYITGYTDDTVISQDVRGPGRVLLQKPFGPRELVDKVRETLSASAPGPTPT